MSDVPHGADSPQGPDWWQASDDRWYPGELHPWRQGAAGSSEPSAFFLQGHPVHQTLPADAPSGRRISGRAALTGFVVLLVAVLVSVVVIGTQSDVRSPSSRGALRSAEPAAAAHGSTLSPTTTAPGASPTVAPVVPNPTGSSTGPNASQALTTAAVTHVFKQMWPLFANYASEDYLPGLLSIATKDVAHVVQAQDVCGCDEFWSSYTSVEVTASQQDSYPLSFFAEVDQKNDPDGPEIQMLVFERQTAVAPWLITYAMGYAGTVPLLTAPADLGSVPTFEQPQITPFVELAALFNSLRQTGSALAGDYWDSLINEPGKELTNFASDLTDGYDLDQGLGITPEANFGVVDYSAAFPVPGGSITCAAINSEVTMRPADGSTMVQTNSSSTFGALVPPGAYSTVTYHEAVDTCLVLVGGFYGMQGLSGGTYSATWTK